MASPTQDLSYKGLAHSDPQLKNLPLDKYSKQASVDKIEQTKKSLEAKTHKCTVVEVTFRNFVTVMTVHSSRTEQKPSKSSRNTSPTGQV
jgi:hypothetical protein